MWTKSSAEESTSSAVGEVVGRLRKPKAEKTLEKSMITRNLFSLNRGSADHALNEGGFLIVSGARLTERLEGGRRILRQKGGGG